MKTIITAFCAILASQAALYQSGVCYLRHDVCVGSTGLWLFVAECLICGSHLLVFVATFGAVVHLVRRDRMSTSEAIAIAFTWMAIAEAALAGIAKRELWYLYRGVHTESPSAIAVFTDLTWFGGASFVYAACTALIAWSAVSVAEDTKK